MVLQFEMCGREIHPELFQNFLPRYDAYLFIVVFLNSLPGLFTVPLTRLKDLLRRRSFVLLLSIYARCFLIIFLASSQKYLRKIFNNYLTLSNKNESDIASHSFRKD